MAASQRPAGGVGGSPGDDPVGKVLAGKYRVVRRIGGGAVADVYEAVHEQIGSRLALKILRREFARFPEVSRRFLTEARAASSVGHPGIIQVFDIGQLDGGELFMVMELLQGLDLSVLQLQDGRFDPSRAAGIACQLLGALEAAHKAGVIHRDLKPENVLLLRGPAGEEWAKIIDFGIARLTQDGPAALRRTAEGSVLGSPYYMSPEQARGQGDLDARTDLYAVGVMLYEMLTGELPYTGTSIQGIVERLLSDPFPKPREVVPSIPEELERVILRATARNRDDRFATAAEFAEALRPFRGEGALHAPPPPKIPGGRRAADQEPTVSPRTPDASPAVPGEPGAGPRTPAAVVVPPRVYVAAIGAAVVAALVVVGIVLWLGRGGDSHGRAGAPIDGGRAPSAVETGLDTPAPDATVAGPDAGLASEVVASSGDDSRALDATVETLAPDASAETGSPDTEPESSLSAVPDTGSVPPVQIEPRETVSRPRDAGAVEPRESGAGLPPGRDAVVAPPATDAGGGPSSHDAVSVREVGFAPNPFGG